jgi:hypothetical protein
MDSDEAWVTLFHEKRTSANVTIDSHLRGGSLYSESLIRPTAAQNANPLHKPVLCVHHVTAGDPDQAIDPASSALPLSELAPAGLASAPTALVATVLYLLRNLQPMYFSSCRTTAASQRQLG